MYIKVYIYNVYKYNIKEIGETKELQVIFTCICIQELITHSDWFHSLL